MRFEFMFNSNYVVFVFYLVVFIVNGFIDMKMEIISIDVCMDVWVIKVLMFICIGDECIVDGFMDDFLNNMIVDILDI